MQVSHHLRWFNLASAGYGSCDQWTWWARWTSAFGKLGCFAGAAEKLVTVELYGARDFFEEQWKNLHAFFCTFFMFWWKFIWMDKQTSRPLLQKDGLSFRMLWQFLFVLRNPRVSFDGVLLRIRSSNQIIGCSFCSFMSQLVYILNLFKIA